MPLLLSVALQHVPLFLSAKLIFVTLFQFSIALFFHVRLEVKAPFAQSIFVFLLHAAFAELLFIVTPRHYVFVWTLPPTT
jgi:hypothetical protein